MTRTDKSPDPPDSPGEGPEPRDRARENRVDNDQRAYERSVKLAGIRQMLPAYLISFAVAAGVVALGFAVTVPRDHFGRSAIGAQTGPPPAGAPRPQIPPIPAIGAEPIAQGKMLLERAVSGQLDERTMDSLRRFPEFDRCQECFRQCEEDAGSTAAYASQNCKRNCLQNCSDNARSILNY